MRKLPAAAQEERRRQVIGLRQSGMTYQEIADLVGLSRTGVFNICQRYRNLGVAGLRSKPHGPPVGTTRRLSAAQEAEIRSLIRRHTPDGSEHCSERLALRALEPGGSADADRSPLRG